MEKIGFLLEANNNTGGGHFWRCLNLAKILKKRNRIFYFISKNLNKSFVQTLRKEKINYLNINSLKKISCIKDILKKEKIEVFISDYYHLDVKKKKEIKKMVKTFIVIDDFTHKKPYTKNSLREQVESDAMKVINCTSSTLYKDFAFNLFKNNPFNPLNIFFFIIGFYTYFIRNDMRELICIARKLK